MNMPLRSILCTFLLFLFASCVKESEIKDFDFQVEQFRSQISGDRFDEIYDNADPQFRTSGTREEVIRFHKSVKGGMGALVASKRRELVRRSTPEGLYFVGIYESQFENGQAVETFNYVKRNDLLLVGYHIETQVDLNIPEET